MEFALGLVVGGVIAGLFAAYRLRGDRAFTAAVTDVARLGRPAPRPPK